MPYKVRPISWELLLNPVSQGLQMEVNASQNLGAGIASAGRSIGAGLSGIGERREAKRQFDAKMALGRDELQQRRDEMLEKARERQASKSEAVDGLIEASDLVMGEQMTTGQVTNQTADAIKKAADAVGGAAAGQDAILKRGEYPDLIAAHTNGTLPAPGALPEQRLLPGEMGVPLRPSHEAAAAAAEAASTEESIKALRASVLAAIKRPGGITSKQQEALALRAKQLASAIAAASYRKGEMTRQAKQGERAEELAADIALERARAEMKRGEQEIDRKSYIDSLRNNGHQIRDDASYVEAKALFDSTIGAKAREADEQRVFKAEESLKTREAQAARQSVRAEQREREISLRERAQSFKENESAAKYASGAAKTKVKELQAEFDNLMKMSKNALERDGDSESANRWAAEAAKRLDAIQKLREGADVGLQQDPAPAGAPGPAGTAAPTGESSADRLKRIFGGG